MTYALSCSKEIPHPFGRTYTKLEHAEDIAQKLCREWQIEVHVCQVLCTFRPTIERHQPT